MIFDFPLKVPTLDSATGTLTHTTFETKDEFTEYVDSKFKQPGQYGLKNTKLWQAEYLKFKKKGSYINYVKGTFQWEAYWKAEKEKILKGFIVDDFYIPPFYYFYLNFLEIYNKVKGKFWAPDVFDSDYHFFLYIMRCILKGKHAGVVKTRQRGYSYKIMAILYWSYMWFQGAVNTLGASDKDYTEKTWKYLDQYRQFIHSHTPWKRGPQVPKSLNWIERSLMADGNTWGNGSSLVGTTFQQSPSKGVGGPQKFFFYEEAGIAPTLLKTIEYIRPAIEEGDLATGLIIVSGSVGELKDCEPLKAISRNPEGYNFLGVDPVHKKDEGWSKNGKTCLFVPETWNRYGYMDEDGNSLVEQCEIDLLEQRKFAKDSKSLGEYQLQISQKPLSLTEAFAFRSDSYFPQAILANQLQKLEIKKPKTTVVELFEKPDGGISYTTNTEKQPILSFPLQAEDPRGAVVIKEFPEENVPFLTYFAGVDPISTDKTTTSESLFSVTIFKNLLETKYEDDDGNIRSKTTGFEPVAWYCGRMEDLKQTNIIGEYLIRYYNAFTVVESNVQSFINHMQSKGLQKYLATKQDITFIGDLGANQNVHKQYGVHMTPTIKNYILANIKEYVAEELDYIRTEEGEKIKTIYGVERIEDIPLLEEIKQWHENLNTDRIISFGLALSMAKSYMMNGIFNKKSEIKKREEEFLTSSRSFFKILDRTTTNPIRKQYFKLHG